MEQQLRRSLTPVWSEVRQIRHDIGDLLRACPRELRNATAMTASELLENAIKYGQSAPGAPSIEFSLRMAPDCLRVEVTSGTSDPTAVARLRQRIRELSSAEDRASYCIKRLEDSARSPVRPGDRGLYRIGSEGGFDLECLMVDRVVTVVATRRIQ